MASVNPVIAGLACRCPECGRGRMFSGFLAVTPQCGVCGLDVTKAAPGDGPTTLILLVSGSLGCFGIILNAFNAPNMPAWLLVLIWLPLTGVLSMLLLRPTKAMMIALQYHFQRRSHRDDGDVDH